MNLIITMAVVAVQADHKGDMTGLKL